MTFFPTTLRIPILAAALLIIANGCATDATSEPGNTTANKFANNTLYFDSLFTNLSVSSDDAVTEPWGLRSTAGTAPLLAPNFKFAKKPTANGTYRVKMSGTPIASNECMFFVNYLDGANSTTYFPSDSTKTVKVTIEGGKVHAVIEDAPVNGNRGGNAIAPISLNLLER